MTGMSSTRLVDAEGSAVGTCQARRKNNKNERPQEPDAQDLFRRCHKSLTKAQNAHGQNEAARCLLCYIRRKRKYWVDTPPEFSRLQGNLLGGAGLMSACLAKALAGSKPISEPMQSELPNFVGETRANVPYCTTLSWRPASLINSKSTEVIEITGDLLEQALPDQHNHVWQSICSQQLRSYPIAD